MSLAVSVSCIFGSVSGSTAAPSATVAKIALPELKKRGYDEMVSLGSLAGAGTLGILIPPSITMVVYAVAANVSIIQIFLAGFLPGFLVMALYSGYSARIQATYSAGFAHSSCFAVGAAGMGDRNRMRATTARPASR